MKVDLLDIRVNETIEKMADPFVLADFLEFCGRGNMFNYSLENLLAIYSQKPYATFVGRFDAWKTEGRYPKGSGSAIAVYPSNTSGKTGVLANYTDIVYDIMDTKGEIEARPDYEWSLDDREGYA